MSWHTLTLGSIDLTSGYTVLRAGDGGLKPNLLAQTVPYRNSDGARLVFAREAESPRVLHVEIHGSDIDDTKAKEAAIRAALVAARNYPRTGTALVYTERSTGETTAQQWKVLWGRWDRSYELLVAGRLDGILTLALSAA
jgi:hypothetical protein